MPDQSDPHYCIQTDRIASMDGKIDGISKHFQVDGMVGKMSGQMQRLTVLIENGKDGKDAPTLPPKIVWWVVLGLVLIIAVLVGVEIPVG